MRTSRVQFLDIRKELGIFAFLVDAQPKKSLRVHNLLKNKK